MVRFDSVEQDEYMETINKLGSNVRALESAERMLFAHHVVCFIQPLLHRLLV